MPTWLIFAGPVTNDDYVTIGDTLKFITATGFDSIPKIGLSLICSFPDFHKIFTHYSFLFS